MGRRQENMGGDASVKKNKDGRRFYMYKHRILLIGYRI